MTRLDRIVEIGYIRYPEHMELTIWLMAINRNQLSKILLKGYQDLLSLLQSIQDKELSPTIVDQTITRIGLSKFECEVDNDMPEGTVCLISGSMHFLNLYHKN